jgi:alpha-L-fucosidase 2
LHDGNHAYKLLSEFIKNNVYINLFGFHPPFQIDCNFGYASGVSEMLLQSHMGYIEFLPALPDAWPQGYIHGIKARGAFVLNIDWQTGKLSQAEIISEKGARCKIYSPEPLTITSGGRRVKSTRDGNIISFATRKGKTYKVTPAK